MTRALLISAVVFMAMPVQAHDAPCNAKVWRDLVGQTVDRIEDLHLPDIFRVIYPDSSRDVAPDPARLNFEVDAEEVIRDVHCG